MTGKRIAQIALVAAGVFNVAVGLWAFFAPRSFFDALASEFDPYNRHLVHDIGAFTAGVGATALLALVWRNAWAVALGGNAVAAVAHFGSHLIDRDLGSSPTDPFGLALFAALVVTGLVAVRSRAQPTNEEAGRATAER